MKRERPLSQRMFEEITKILYYHDPMRFAAMHCPEDEYDIEAACIVSGLRNITDLRDMRLMIYDVFVRCFSETSVLPNSDKCYRYIAEETWDLWQEAIAQNEVESKEGVKQVKKEILKTDKETFDKTVTEILYQHDPLTLVKFGVPDDEYTSESKDIILQLQYVTDVRSLKWSIYNVFLKYYSKESIAPYRDERYQRIAEKIWDLWQKVIDESEAEAKERVKQQKGENDRKKNITKTISGAFFKT